MSANKRSQSEDVDTPAAKRQRQKTPDWSVSLPTVGPLSSVTKAIKGVATAVTVEVHTKDNMLKIQVMDSGQVSMIQSTIACAIEGAATDEPFTFTLDTAKLDTVVSAANKASYVLSVMPSKNNTAIDFHVRENSSSQADSGFSSKTTVATRCRDQPRHLGHVGHDLDNCHQFGGAKTLSGVQSASEQTNCA